MIFKTITPRAIISSETRRLAVEYFLRNPNISLPEIAKRYGISANYLSKLITANLKKRFDDKHNKS